MTTKQKLSALKVLEDTHKLKHSQSDSFRSHCPECGCAFGIVWRMVNDMATTK